MIGFYIIMGSFSMFLITIFVILIKDYKKIRNNKKKMNR